AGTYSATLTITTSGGETASTTIPVIANAPGAPPPTDVFGRAVYDQDPWAYYRLGEGSGSTAADSGADSRNGSYVSTSGNWTTVAGALVNSDNAAKQSGGGSTSRFV